MGDSKRTIVFAVRHGETEWNLVGRSQGHLDSPLTDRGVNQAHALAKRLRGRGVDVIYSSDLGRASRTANIIAGELNLNVHIDARLRERHLGLLQGMTHTEFSERFSKAYAALASGDPEYVIPGGESARQRYSRCISCCTELVARHRGRTILLVMHGGLLMSLLYYTLHIPLSEPRRFSIFNAAFNRFSISRDIWHLDCWGDISHLRDMTTLDDE